ncbi:MULTISPECIES: His-Xaa-Ser system radical SAM maturase HxsC [Myxococcaceae]|uniref:His-Xaa-Ser system radical SAM maturase HxsC n=1 Tax=Myxococcaceae TaxID=31 RepID=UPI00188FC0AD|nr:MULTISPECIES: His-Xaa-Ser system radical SAM maturase HxsC [Myxococcaceae]MBF5043307.1 His-Xaa-Ser system radical SAM maturase HxsC [Simulacricoccus sp. 17bor-14]
MRLPDGPSVALPEELSYLREGDVVRVVPYAGEFNVLYRRASPHNSMLLTERCNSFCVMCSQPPKEANDGFLADVWLQAIPLMAPETRELGLSGGEPALLGDRFIELLRACKSHLPSTALHVLSNGRLFNYLSLAKQVANVACADLMIGIPLYSDLPAGHDFVVQARGAFEQTLRGIMNLKRCGVKVELRVVLHKETIDRLPRLARFISRNLAFVDHVALMGLELMGFARGNLEALWVDPADYQAQLRAAVEELVRGRLQVSIYNHPLCVLDRSLWAYARKSISDWKNEYLPSCVACTEREQCGGLFASATLRRSAHIAPIFRGASG